MSLRFGILGLLTCSSMTGYSLKKSFDQRINHLWTASLSQIYRELGILEKDGYISSVIEKQEERPDKKVYSITNNGKKAFQNWLSDFPDNLSSTKRDAFMLRIFFGARLKREELLVQFNRFIKQKEEYISQIRVVEKQLDLSPPEEDRLFFKFTLKRARMTLETMIRWAGECAGELKGLPEKQ